MKYPTTWVRQNDGGYSRSGQLEKNTRRVQITIADGDSFGHYRPRRAIEIIEQAIASGHARAERYGIVPTADEKRKMPEAVKEFLRARRANPMTFEHSVRRQVLAPDEALKTSIEKHTAANYDFFDGSTPANEQKKNGFDAPADAYASYRRRVSRCRRGRQERTPGRASLP